MVAALESPAAQGSRRALVDDTLSWLPGVTGLAAATELLVLRLFTRTAIHIPGLTRLKLVFVPIAEAGRFTFYLGTVLLLMTLLLFVRDLTRGQRPSGRWAASGIVLFLASAALARLGRIDELGLDLATVAGVVALTAWAVRGLPGRAGVPVILFGCAFIFAAMYEAGQGIGSGGIPSGGSSLALAGEALAIGAALAAPVLLGGAGGRRALVWGIGAGGLTSSALLANGSTVRILLLWNFGLAGYLPWVAYGLAAGAIAYTIVALRRAGRRTLALGLAFLFIGGIGLHSTYQSGLVLGGLALTGMGDPGVTVDRATMDG